MSNDGYNRYSYLYCYIVVKKPRIGPLQLVITIMLYVCIYLFLISHDQPQ